MKKLSKSSFCSCMILFFLLFYMFGQSVSPSHAKLLDNKFENAKISIDFRDYVKDPDLQNAVFDALLNRPQDLLVGNQFAITSERLEGEWALISIASLDGPNCTSEYVGSGDCGNLLLAYKDGSWTAALKGTALFSQILLDSPDYFIAPDAKHLLDPLNRKKITTPSEIYEFPWVRGEWQYWWGWGHDIDDHLNAIDIGTAGSDRRILAAANGVITSICSGTKTKNVAIWHDDNKTFEYWHLDRSSVGVDIAEGKYVLRGQLLGNLKQGGFVFDGCGRATQSTAHIHWVLPDDVELEVNGWRIQYNDSTWRNGDQERKPNQSPYHTLSSTNDLLVKQVKPFDTWINIPGGWPYLFRGSDNRIRAFRIGDGPIYTLDTCDAVWVNLGAGHNLVYFWYEMRDAGVPTLDVHAWPYEPPVCAVGPTDPPTDPLNPVDGALLISEPGISVVLPNQSFTKTWRVRNTGTTIWGAGYQLASYSGEQMNGPDAVNLPTVAPGQEVDLSINLTAPSSLGNHEGSWRLRNPQGTYFGSTIRIKITVQNDAPPDSTDEVSLTCVDCPSVLAPGQTYRPKLRATVRTGQLLESRGDMLLNTDGRLFGAHRHVMVLGTVNSGQSYDFVFYANDPLTAPDTPGTYYTSWRVWRNGNWVGPTVTIRFDVRVGGGTRPSPPTLTSPGNWSQFLEGNTPALCVSPDAGMEYYFQVYESHDVPESGWISNNCWTPPGLGPYNYQWHVKARNTANNLESDWSETWHFTLNSTQLTIENLEFSPGSPSNSENIRVYTCVNGFGGIGLGLKIEANTATDGSANGDWYWIHHLGTFCYNHGDTNTWPTWETLPLADGDHLVRAVGFGPQGQTVEKTAVYHLERRRPNRPDLVNPTNDIWLNTTDIAFSWKPAHRVNSYRLVAGTNSDPTIDPIVDQTLSASATSYAASFPTAPQDLYWRLYAINEMGSSDTQWHFRIDLNKPASSVSDLPATTYEPAFQVSWGGSDDLSGIRWYDVQVRDGNRPDSEWVDWLTNVTHISDIFVGQAGHTYYFRARALDVAGNLEDWPASGYDTVTTVDPSSRPPTPWWDSAYTYKRNLVLLNNASQTLTTGYPMYLHFDSATTPTASELYAASQSTVKGDDFRIVYNNQTELARFIQTFTADAIDIWFNLQADIAPTPASDSTSYQLYYGNISASSPSSDPDTVFSPVVDGNTVALWRFFEGSGSTVSDASGHGYSGSAQNMGWAQGKFGPAGFFNGQNTVVNMGTSDAFNLPQFTFETWIKLDQLGRETTIFRKEASDTSLIYDVQIDQQVNVRINGSSCYVIGNTHFVTGRWYHMAWTYDGSTLSVYLNGRFDGSQYCGQTLRTGPYPLWIGGDGRSMNKWLNGYLQLARVSNIARSSFPYGGYADVLTEPSLVAGEALEQTTSGSPDLAILNVAAYPNPGGGLIIQALAKNQGDKNTLSGFYTDLYLDHVPAGLGDFSGSVQFWVNDPVAPGQMLTLTTILDTPVLFGVNSLAALAPAAEVNGTLYAQIDSTGSVVEPDDTNNIFTQGVGVCFASPDAFEPDDSSSQATIIAPGNSQVHNFDGPTDADWFRFDAQEGGTYIFQTSNLATSADTYLYLYDTDAATLLASNDDYNGTLASSIRWTATKTGTFYILIQHWNPNAGGCQNSYTLSVSDGRIYLPLFMHTSAVPIETTIYGQTTDGEVLNLSCTDWSTCRNAATGNANWQGLNVGTIGASYYAPDYLVQRVFLFFNTAAIQSNASITGAVLHLYTGDALNGTTTVHVVRSTAITPLSTAAFSKITFVSGGTVTPTTPNSWITINLSPTALTWIAKGGLTKLALINEYDLNNITPTVSNDVLVALAEDTQHRPYLTITYLVP